MAEDLAAAGDVVGQAVHLRAAGPQIDPGLRAEVLLAAGRAALTGYAFAEARQLFEEVLAAAEVARPDLVTPAYLGLGESWRWAQQLGAASRVWRRALDDHRGPRDPRTRAHLYYLIADSESHRDLTAAGRAVAAGLAELAGAEPSDEEMELLFVELMTARRRLALDRMQQVLHRMRQLAPQVGTPLAEGLTWTATMVSRLELADYTGAAQALAAGTDAAVPPWERTAAGAGIRAMVASGLGDLPALRDANREIAATERELGTYAWGYRAAVHRFVEAFYRGDWDRAAEELDPVIADDQIDDPRGVAVAVLFKPLVPAFRGDFDTARRWIEAGRARLDSGHVPERYGRRILNLVAAMVALEQDEPVAALGLLDGTEDAPTGMLPPWGLIALAEARARAGRPGPALKLATRLAGLGPAGSYPPVMAARLSGLADAAHGDVVAAGTAFDTARDGFTRLGMPFEAARSTVEAVESFVGAGADPPGPLADDLTVAYRAVDRLGALRYAGRAARLLRLLGRPVPRTAPAAGAPLTPRQQEIAVLVSQGLSNAAIAERLFLSVRTVTSHLEHIYTRLGINSRAALASYVIGAGPLRSSTDAAGGRPAAG